MRGLPDGATPPAVLINAFAETLEQGNGAAVVLLDKPASAAWMQSVASCFKQSETAFLLPMAALEIPGPGQDPAPNPDQPAWALRWFTPSCEVPLCGHATLAATLALAHWKRLARGSASCFQTRSGGLTVRCHPDHPEGEGLTSRSSAGSADLVLPASPLEACPLPQDLSAFLGVSLQASWRSDLGYWVALLAEAADLASLDGQAFALALAGELRAGLVLMQGCPSGEGRPLVMGKPADYQLRFFAPGLGISEDPVTGSAHALVAPWWCAQRQRRQVVGWQASSQGGGMLCERLSSGMIQLTGSGRLIWDGVLITGCAAGATAEWRRCLPGS
ncbi:PhzF family phenazine biosynthesis isomerase [Synechococcus sp. CS-602]|uniref:PhzF family phenazine biosynthesis protein n=1 Tax=Synechococcaceae TaxID=1890426 RepID=UPI0008FF6AE5|nr:MULTISPECIES: PhzF family phenazine biosynthesis isomerase [Synechococcaceae]MCT4364229.1 PhzF family phenazine biosynthesis isomerase [Candidatus Regnicoccus frigidus MAG-AL1]APD48953.1 phenazine biosynthesis protein PhzF family [Synechococcus sp. SynAce01]MCT0204575.1 PhzF family phenazine biosynthesis isomerase [Synechococcus sp. CS-602]MCT0246367.1 PhzF family phenazine biosynthesis isomerase [Synechococcus sp. CS-601]MCT4367125.1 PhzF family phenazine biosynthesis isomerase [Candidatus